MVIKMKKRNEFMNQAIILAGGKGTRMQSDLPKVLYFIKGVSIIQRLLDNVKVIFADPVIIIGYKGDEIISALGDRYSYVHQDQQLGTGHAVMCAKKVLVSKDYQNIIVIPGDHPLISAKTLQKLIHMHEREKAKLTLAIVSAPNFGGGLYKFFKLW